MKLVCAFNRTLLICVLLIGSAAAFVSCMPIDCKDTVLLDSPSPNGKIIATVFERDCGATTAKNVQVCFRVSTAAFNPKQQESFLVLETDGKIELSWTNQDKLIVQVPNQSKIFRNKTDSNGVKIEYHQQGGTSN